MYIYTVYIYKYIYTDIYICRYILYIYYICIFIYCFDKRESNYTNKFNSRICLMKYNIFIILHAVSYLNA